ncbi:hypothetical protein ACX0G9_09905 [Flavitalea flava]
MNTPEIVELKNIDPEDISDVLVKIDKSFDLKLKNNAFDNARTFGDICDIIFSKIRFDHVEGCTTQQAFYKIRQSIAMTQQVEKNTISPDTVLEGLIPRKGRRQKMPQIEKELGFPLKILRPREWLISILLISLLLSIISLFINWETGLVGLIIVITGYIIAGWFGKEFSVQTVGEIANKMTRDNYLKSRRNPKTVTLQEIDKNIRDLFNHNLNVDPSVLTKEASLF